MKTLLAALALVALVSGATPALAVEAKPIIVADGGCNGCAIDQPDTISAAADTGGRHLQRLRDADTTRTKMADSGGCSNCAIEQPSDEPIITQEPTPRPAPQRADATTKPSSWLIAPGAADTSG